MSEHVSLRVICRDDMSAMGRPLDRDEIIGSTHKWITSWLSQRSKKKVLDGQNNYMEGSGSATIK